MSVFRLLHRRIAVASTICVLAAVLSRSSHAADGTITFDGVISDQTCQINGLDKKADLLVRLPKINTSALSSSGDTAGLTAFTLKITGCKTTTGSVYPHFLFGPTIDPETGRLRNTSSGFGGAKNVQVALLNDDLSTIDLTKDAGAQNVIPAELSAVTSGEPATTNGEATLKFFAQYVATGGGASAGAVGATVQYAMVYP